MITICARQLLCDSEKIFFNILLVKAGERITVSGMEAGRVLIVLMGLLAALSLCSFADGQRTPQITLSVTDEPLSVVLESISKQAGVAIVMTNEAAGQEPVSLKVRNAELENALEQALRNYNYTLSFSAEENVISKVVVTVREKKEGFAGMFDPSKRGQTAPSRTSAASRPVSVAVPDSGEPPLTGRALTLHMAEAERLRGKMYAPVEPRKRPEGFVGMEEVVYRMANVKANGGQK